MNNYKIEICAGCIDSVKAATNAGADRVELCDNLIEGGTTPSYGLIKAAVKENIKVNVIIRPRGGDFLYSDAEFEIMKEDIRMCKELGAHGVVIGMLDKFGNIDKTRTKQLVNEASGMDVCFHRAFDMANDWEKSIQAIIDCGCHRILSSGMKNSALEGLENIQKYVKTFGDKISIMPGSGINSSNIKTLRDVSGAKEFHLSARTVKDGNMEFRKDGIAMGGSIETGEYGRKISDEQIIKEIIQLING